MSAEPVPVDAITAMLNPMGLPARAPKEVVKRSGKRQAFDHIRIERAMALCFMDLGQLPRIPITTLADVAARRLAVFFPDAGEPPSVEDVQDEVEATLIAAEEHAAAEHYRRYRETHQQQREERPLPAGVQEAFAQSAAYFPTAVQQFQFYDKYARYDHDKARRETWLETVERAVDYLQELVSDHTGGQRVYSDEEWDDLREGILQMEVMPSMRLLAMAGPAARRQNLSIFNCSYLPVADLEAFPEALIISMSGCGVGFSVERRYIEQFPRVARQRNAKEMTHVVEDTTEGWAAALRTGLVVWMNGSDIDFDLSQVRPAGAILMTKGGRASGPEPLRQMLAGIRRIVLSRQGSYLRSLDAHDMMCLVGNAAVMGGTRRTAMISLFDWDDDEMRHAKDPATIAGHEERWNANNSAVWPEGDALTQLGVMRQFLEMAEAGSGEPGIFNRASAWRHAPHRRKMLGYQEFGTNPCGEIVLRPYGLCNLSIAVARPDDTLADLGHKVKLAARIGIIQSLATKFPGLRPEWSRNAQEERLIGVDITGQRDCPLLAGSEGMAQANFRNLKTQVLMRATEDAARLGINIPAATTTVKPSGNSSLLLNCASGLHARWAPYYIRNIRVGAHSPLYQVLRDAGAPLSPENGQTAETAETWVCSFPIKSPEGAVTRKDVSALEQCEFWLRNKRHWTEHNPSVTITYQPSELLGVTQWVWQHRSEIGGMAFLPAFDASYALMPYEEISESEYHLRAATFPEIDYAKLYRYEQEDMSIAAQELACLAGNCDI